MPDTMVSVVDERISIDDESMEERPTTRLLLVGLDTVVNADAWNGDDTSPPTSSARCPTCSICSTTLRLFVIVTEEWAVLVVGIWFGMQELILTLVQSNKSMAIKK